jgi:hypothetical protein
LWKNNLSARGRGRNLCATMLVFIVGTVAALTTPPVAGVGRRTAVLGGAAALMGPFTANNAVADEVLSPAKAKIEAAKKAALDKQSASQAKRAADRGEDPEAAIPNKRPPLPSTPKLEDLNEAEQRLASLLAKSVADREQSLGFTLDSDDIAELEDILRNKYCGKQGMWSSLPGGTCAESKPSVTCFSKPGAKGEAKQIQTMNSLGKGATLGDPSGAKGCL